MHSDIEMRQCHMPANAIEMKFLRALYGVPNESLLRRFDENEILLNIFIGDIEKYLLYSESKNRRNVAAIAFLIKARRYPYYNAIKSDNWYHTSGDGMLSRRLRRRKYGDASIMIKAKYFRK